jgi:sporulation protein YlmC with PRC-barrel domain
MRMEIGLNLLDRQIVDAEEQPVGKVDDVELHIGEDGGPVVTALLVGQEALGRRIGGALGTALAGLARRMRIGGEEPIRIPYELVRDIDSAITLSVRKDAMPEPPLETFLRDHLISHIPGAHHAGA